MRNSSPFLNSREKGSYPFFSGWRAKKGYDPFSRRSCVWVLAVAAVCLAAVSIATAATTTLLDAAESGDRATALRLLANRADPNVLGPDGTTAIMWAAHHDQLDVVQALIKAGANVKLKNQFGTSALAEAAVIGSAPIIDALLKAGADPNTKNPEGETPLMAVARSGHVDAARRLLDAGADVNAKESWGGQSALMWAAAQRQAEMVKFLASRGADLNARGVIRQWDRKVIAEPRPKDLNKGGFTSLLYAAREGCVECARNLIAAKADLDLADPDGVTPLNMALPICISTWPRLDQSRRRRRCGTYGRRRSTWLPINSTLPLRVTARWP